MNQKIIKDKIEKKFTDQFFVSTQGRNDIRRDQILELFEKKNRK